METILNHIGGRSVPALGGAVLPVHEPATGRVFAMAPDSDARDVDEAVAAAQAAIAAEPAPVRVPRERKPVVLADEGPLILVETKKDLSQLKLPFEQQTAA